MTDRSAERTRAVHFAERGWLGFYIAPSGYSVRCSPTAPTRAEAIKIADREREKAWSTFNLAAAFSRLPVFTQGELHG